MTFLISLAAILSFFYLFGFCDSPHTWTRSVVKTLSVAILALAAYLASGPAMLVLALTLCALGDLLLSRDPDPAFMAGVAAFASGHLAYVALFLSHPLATPEAVLNPNRLPIILILPALGLIMAAILWPRAGKLRGPVVVYIPVILSMGMAVLVLPALGPLALAAPAAALFILSDMALAIGMFVLQPGTRLYRITPYIVWSTYWLVQLGFFLAFAGLPWK